MSYERLKKRCARCRIEKERSAFSRNYKNKDTLEAYCKVCRSTIKKDQYKSRLAGKYGITLQDYNRMIIEQDGRCAICLSDDPRGRGGNFHIDHCHSSNTVRGLLCANCNTAIGLLFENIETLANAIQYLEKFKHLKSNVIEIGDK